MTGDIYGDTEGNAYLHLKVQTSLGGTLIPQIHAILRNGKDEEISSKSRQDGAISFRGLTHNKYSIEIVKDERIIGNISLDLSG